MTFGYPETLWYLTALPPVGIVLILVVRRSLRTIQRFTGDYQRKDVVATHVVRYFILSVLFTGTFVALIFALAEPSWGDRMVEDERRGVEIAFVIDVSNSMRAEDVDPSRLARARSVARTVAGRIPDSRTAVVIFKGAATVLVPMTEDQVSFDLAMSNLSGALITTAGTNLRDGLSAALDQFPAGSPRHRLIVLFTDGEELQESVDGLADRIRTAEIPILVVQTGTAGGATIPVSSGDVIRDSDGNPVIAGVDEAVLRRIADLSNGALYRISDSGVTQALYDDIRRYSGDDAEVLFRRSGESRYHLFVLLALIFLCGSVVVQSVPWGRQRGVE
ncbi:MAG: VWA domain-containing protein [Spirochaeta sp.]|nr:VWA domain-containing protein [Spirochaeta sp.]